jgi:hypothetical protein
MAFLLLAVSMALSLLVAGVYWTVTVHDLRGPSEFPLQVSDVIENGDGLGSETVSAPVAEPPSFVSVNVSEGV